MRTEEDVRKRLEYFQRKLKDAHNNGSTEEYFKYKDLTKNLKWVLDKRI